MNALRLLILILWLLALFLMVHYKCIGCTRTFKTSTGLNLHRSKCPGRSAAIERAICAEQANESVGIVREALDGLRVGGLPIAEGGDNNHSHTPPTHDIEPQVEAIHQPPPLLLPPTRSGRKRKAPRTLQDFRPSGFVGRLHKHVSQLVPKDSPPVSNMPLISPNEIPSIADGVPLPEPIEHEHPPPLYRTEPDEFGVFREYHSCPTKVSNIESSQPFLSDSPSIAIEGDTLLNSIPRLVHTAWDTVGHTAQKWFLPFANASIARLLQWSYSGSPLKSGAEVQRLVDEVISAPDFKKEHLAGVNVRHEEHRLDEYEEATGPLSSASGWREGSVPLRLPKEGVKYPSEDDAPTATIHGIWYRPLIEIIRSAYEDASAKAFQHVPFKLFHAHAESSPGPDNTNEPPVRVFTEAYTADLFLQEDANIRSRPRHPDDSADTEYAVAPLLVWSDSTRLAAFGSASLWPIYLFFGALSKYIRCAPNTLSAHHVAYIPSLPDTIQDSYKSIYGCLATSAVLRFLKNELMQQIWLLLLDEKFMEAYQHGMLVRCGDGILRRLFPRFFSYSADYPERVLLSCIRFLAKCPCPLCLVQKADIAEMGTRRDAAKRQNTSRDDTVDVRTKIQEARKWVFERGYSTASAMIQRVLEPMSLLTTQSAFSTRFSPYGINFYSMFVPDLMHEFELGVWKAIFAHLVRVLYASASDKVAALNERFRTVPPFGRDTIRRFRSNVSAMKHLAARDYEDILQCIIPCIEGLLPDSTLNDIVLDLLWELTTWHALAKLRLHTEKTLEVFEKATATLGTATRRFAKACENIETHELPSEVAARARRRAAASKSDSAPRTVMPRAKRKILNLSTFKWHSLGHYPWVIRLHGTTESYSTQTGELEHRRGKRFYIRTNKIKAEKQIATHERRQRKLYTISLRDRKRRIMEVSGQRSGFPTDTSALRRGRGRPRKYKTFGLSFAEQDPLPSTAFDAHHHMSKSCKFAEDLTEFANTHGDDPSMKEFVPHLKDHLITRLLGLEYDGEDHEFNDEERDSLEILHNRIYRHKVLRINYTTYDMRRDQSSINPRTHADVMVLAHEDYDKDSAKFHPYWYARVLGVFHAVARYVGPTSTAHAARWQSVEFLRIHWFGRDMSSPAGFRARRLLRVGFVDEEDPAAYSFLDPQHVIRGVHVIPAFHRREDDDEDSSLYYINMFADRDMFMRFMGGGIGHKAAGQQVRVEDVMNTLSERSLSEDNHGAYLEPTLLANDPFSRSSGDIEDSDEDDERFDYGYSVNTTRGEERRTPGTSSSVQAEGVTPTQADNSSTARKRKFEEIVAEDDGSDAESDWCGPEDGEDGIEMESDGESEGEW